MSQVVIIGAAGTGQDVAGFLADINAEGPTYECLGFLDDDPAKHGTQVGGLPVLGPLTAASDFPDASFVDCLGSPRTFLQRERRIGDLGIRPDRLETIIHPSALVAAGCEVGGGSILYPFTHLGPGVELGRQVIVLSHSVIHHHSRIGEFTIIASGCNVSGDVEIGRCCYLGTGCSIRDGIAVGARSLVGMGSAVVSAIPADSVAAGVPARVVGRSA